MTESTIAGVTALIAIRLQEDLDTTIFTISATWDNEASVWSGHCDDIPAAADAPTLDELFAKITAMTLDVLPDNHPEVDPSTVYLQITALREAEPAVA